MNANELADELDMAAELEIELGNPENWADFKKAVTMLRQQQAEIEALKLQLHTTLTNRDLRTYDGKENFNKENPVKEVFNTEPVAWMNPKSLECGYGGEVDWEDTGCIPLYTHPAKTLTDIGYETVFDGENYTTKLKEPAKTLTDEEIDTVLFSYKGDIKDFARAILKKASEK
jgi:hypothetical protein